MIGQNKPNILGVVYNSKCQNAFKAGHGAVYDSNNIAPTLVTATGGQQTNDYSEHNGLYITKH